MRGTTCILTILAVIICSISFYLTAELVEEEYGRDLWRLTKSSVTHQLLKMTVYPEDMILDMGNEKTTEEETISSISYKVKLNHKLFDQVLSPSVSILFSLLKSGSVPT